MEAKSVWSVGAELGEGPVWVERDAALWFVDIKRRQIHRYDPAGESKTSWDAPEQIGFLLPAEGGGFVAGLQSGLHRFDESDGSFSPIAAVEPELPGNRLNDGVVEPGGRLWFGTMDDGEKAPTGRFWRYDRNGLAQANLPQVAITNGPAVSPDGRILYFVDTLAGLIHSAEICPGGVLRPSRPFAQIPPGEGYPDGPTVDSEGCVWIGLYAGWEARRYSPRGELIGRVRFPVANITKIAFGGPGLRTIFATTARQGLKPAELEAQPRAGDLFAIEADVPGLETQYAAI